MNLNRRLHSSLAPLPLFLAAAYYASIFLRSPIPSDPNSPIVFISALQGELNLLSQLVRGMLWAQPSEVAFLVVLISVSALYVASYEMGRGMKLGRLASVLPPSLLLILPAVTFAASTGLSMALLPAGLASLGLAISARGTKRRVAAGLGCVLLSAFIDPSYALASGLAALVWAAAEWAREKERERDVPLNHLMFAFDSILVSAAGYSLVRPLSSLQPAPSFLYFQQQPAFYLLLIVAAGAGLYLLFSWRRDVDATVKLASWAAAAFVVGSLIGTLLLMAVPLSALASFPFVFGAKGVATVKREKEEGGDGDVGEGQIIEVDALKALALAVVLVLVLSSISVTLQYVPQLAYSKGVDSSYLLDVASFLKGTNSSIVAPLSILPWLSIYSGSGQRLPSSDPRFLDSWGETSFRLQSDSVRVDDWEPFSASRAPRVAIYDGESFTYLLYVDDSYVQFTMKKDNSSWVESPYGMAFLGGRWLNDSALELSFQSRWLSIEKVIEVEGGSATVSYAFSGTGGAQVVRGEISVFADWPYTIDSFEGGGPLFFLTIGGKGFSFSASEGSTSRYLTEGQPRAVVTKGFGSGSGVLSLKVDCLDSRPSGLSPYRASIFDYFGQQGEGYVVSVKGNPDRLGDVTTSFLPSLYFVDSYQSVKFAVREPISFVLADSYVRVGFYTYTNETAPLLYVVDSYVRANFSSYGSSYMEAPSDGRVLNESLQQGGGRLVTYETAGLLIDKAVASSGSAVSFDYGFRAKDGGNVTAVEGAIWLPWGMNYTYAQGEGYIFLETPMGPFKVTYGGGLNASVGPYGEGGQPAIVIYGSGDRLSFELSAIQPIRLDYFATSRPLMDGSDVVRLSAPYLMGPWVESPAGALVESRGSDRWIAKTKALTFEKGLNVTGGRVDVLYTVLPNDGSNAVILGGWGLVWLNLDISKVEHSDMPRGLEVGGFNITGGASTTGAALGASEYGTTVLNFTFSGRELAVSFEGELNFTYQPSGGGNLDDRVVLGGFLQSFYEESPSNAQVLRDVYDPGSGVRAVEYRTAGLDFVKTVRPLGNETLSVSYEVNASVGASGLEAIYASRAYIWIPWERLLLNYSIEGPSINLTLDDGSFLIALSPKPYNVSFVSDPQPAFLITYEVRPSEVFSYSMTISFSQPLSITYQDGGRPLQASGSSDILTVNARYGYLQLEHEAGDLKVFRVVKNG